MKGSNTIELGTYIVYKHCEEIFEIVIAPQLRLSWS